MPAENMSSIGPQADVNSRIAVLDAEKARLKLIDAETKAQEKLMKLSNDARLKEMRVQQGFTMERDREQFFQNLYMQDQANQVAREDREDQQAFAAEQGAASRAFQQSEAAADREAAVADREDQQKFASEQGDLANERAVENREDQQAFAEQQRQAMIDREEEIYRRKLESIEKTKQINLDITKALQGDQQAIDDQKALFDEQTNTVTDLEMKGKEITRLQEEDFNRAQTNIQNIVEQNEETTRFINEVAADVSEEIKSELSRIQDTVRKVRDQSSTNKVATGYGMGTQWVDMGPSAKAKDTAYEQRGRVVTATMDAVKSVMGDAISDEGVQIMEDALLNLVRSVAISEETNDPDAHKQAMSDALDAIAKAKGELGNQAVAVIMTSVSDAFEGLDDRFQPGMGKESGAEKRENAGGTMVFGRVSQVLDKLQGQAKVSYHLGMDAMQRGMLEAAFAETDPDTRIAMLRKAVASFEGTPEAANLQALLERFTKRDQEYDEIQKKADQIRSTISRLENEIKRNEELLNRKRENMILESEIKDLQVILEGYEDAEGSDQGDSGRTQQRGAVLGAGSLQ